MIVSAYEAQAMIGWGAILGIRVVEITHSLPDNRRLTVDEVIHNPKTEALFDLDKEISQAVIKSVEIVLQAVYDIRPELLETRFLGRALP